MGARLYRETERVDPLSRQCTGEPIARMVLGRGETVLSDRGHTEGSEVIARRFLVRSIHYQPADDERPLFFAADDDSATLCSATNERGATVVRHVNDGFTRRFWPLDLFFQWIEINTDEIDPWVPQRFELRTHLLGGEKSPMDGGMKRDDTMAEYR